MNAEGTGPQLSRRPQHHQWTISRACGKDAPSAAGEQPLHHGGGDFGPRGRPAGVLTGGGPARSGASAQPRGPFGPPTGLRGPRRTHSRVVPSPTQVAREKAQHVFDR